MRKTEVNRGPVDGPHETHAQVLKKTEKTSYSVDFYIYLSVKRSVIY